MQPAINTVGMLRFPVYLSRHSIDPLEFLSRLGINPNLFAQAGAWLPRDFCFQVMQEAANAASVPVFGAAVGASIRLSDFGDFGKHITSAHTLGDALSVSQNELSSVQLGSVIRQETNRRERFYSFEFLGEMKANPHHFVLGSIAVIRTVALLAGEPDAVRVQLSMPKSGSSDLLEEVLGNKLEFGARSDAVIVNRDVLALPLQCRDVDGIPMPVIVARLIMELLPIGEGNLRNIARRLGCSERTIERRLNEFGVSFKSLVDISRRDEAIRLLKDTNFSFADIAQQIGYSDQANFNHAFRRWTGTTPSALRRAGNNSIKLHPIARFDDELPG